MNTSANIRLALPYHSPQIENAVLSVLRSGWLVAGRHTREFEEKLCLRTGRKHAIAVSSGTGALVAAMAALGIGPHSTVVVPAFTFPAPARAAAFLGARVRLCDVDPETFNLSAATLGQVLDSNVSLVVGIDQFGAPCPAESIGEMCARYGIPLLMDAACAIGARLNGRPCGSFGAVSILSFHPRKLVTTGQGGAVLTDDDAIAGAVRAFRTDGQHGQGFLKVGFDLRPSEMGCAIGAVQLDFLDEILERRQALAAHYRKLPFPQQRLIPGAVSNYQSMVVTLTALGEVPGETEAVRFGNPQAFISYLASMGIECGPGSYHLAQLKWLQALDNPAPTDTPNSARCHASTVALPIHCALSDDDVKRVVEACQQWLLQKGK